MVEMVKVHRSISLLVVFGVLAGCVVNPPSAPSNAATPPFQSPNPLPSNTWALCRSDPMPAAYRNAFPPPFGAPPVQNTVLVSRIFQSSGSRSTDIAGFYAYLSGPSGPKYFSINGPTCDYYQTPQAAASQIGTLANAADGVLSLDWPTSGLANLGWGMCYLLPQGISKKVYRSNDFVAVGDPTTYKSSFIAYLNSQGVAAANAATCSFAALQASIDNIRSSQTQPGLDIQALSWP